MSRPTDFIRAMDSYGLLDDLIPRVPRNGPGHIHSDVLKRSDLKGDRFPNFWNQAFSERVQLARAMLRKGRTARQVHEIHGAIVLRQAQEMENQPWP